MTTAGDVYARVFKSHSARFAALDRSKGIWQEVVDDPGGMIIGAEGDNLVFAESKGVWTTLKFTLPDSLRIRKSQQ